jgi:hypothetical protein
MSEQAAFLPLSFLTAAGMENTAVPDAPKLR